MRLSPSKHEKHAEENLIPLINIVFLILIFFLVASTIRPFSDRYVRLATATDVLASSRARQIVIIRQDGSTHIAGREVSTEILKQQFSHWAAAEPTKSVTLVADKNTPASLFVSIVAMANSKGVQNVKLLTQKGN